MLLLPVLFALFEQNSNEHYETIIQILIFTMTLWYLFDTREPSFKEQRLSWETYVDKHNRRGTFKRQLRISQESFEKLLSYIRDDLEVNERMANLRGGTILPELCLYVTLCYLLIRLPLATTIKFWFSQNAIASCSCVPDCLMAWIKE